MSSKLKNKRRKKRKNEYTRNLTDKFPTLTEQHKQLVEVRHELSRQKYVNQVLWRKLNALIDIHGSNTRNELAIELASYQDEIAKLKAYRTPSIIKRVESRSSSGFFSLLCACLLMLICSLIVWLKKNKKFKKYLSFSVCNSNRTKSKFILDESWLSIDKY